MTHKTKLQYSLLSGGKHFLNNFSGIVRSALSKRTPRSLRGTVMSPLKVSTRACIRVDGGTGESGFACDTLALISHECKIIKPNAVTMH
jgi:hypothetical protein